MVTCAKEVAVDAEHLPAICGRDIRASTLHTPHLQHTATPVQCAALTLTNNRL